MTGQIGRHPSWPRPWPCPCRTNAAKTHCAAAKQIQLAGKNKPGGYYVASSDPTVAVESATRTFDAGAVLSAALLTDGAARAVALYDLTTWPNLLTSLDDDGPAALIRAVRAAEASDQSTQRWPRSKPSDDATVAYAVLR